jgi:ketopantoate reductase
MPEIESVLVAGAGAIGTLVAHQFQRKFSGKVAILAGGERGERYRQQGFRVNGAPVEFRLVDVEDDETFDLVVGASQAICRVPVHE